MTGTDLLPVPYQTANVSAAWMSIGSQIMTAPGELRVFADASASHDAGPAGAASQRSLRVPQERVRLSIAAVPPL